MKPSSPRVQVRRLPKRGRYDRESLYSILDEAFICHVGLHVDGNTFVIPMNYGREGDALFLHGASVSRLLGQSPQQTEVCVCVTLVDGLVLARSIFHHSVNYRSAVIFGKASAVTDPEAKWHALEVISEHIVPGRWKEVREPNAQEMKATGVIRIDIGEFSVKERTGGPVDDEEDYELPVWAGVMPLRVVPQEPVPDSRLNDGTPISESIRSYRRPVTRKD